MDFKDFYKLTKLVREEAEKTPDSPEQEEFPHMKKLHEIEEIIDNRLKALNLIQTNTDGAAKTHKNLTLVPGTTPGQLSVIDIDQGTQISTIPTGGKLISAPVVAGRRAAYAVQTENEAIGVVFDLEKGQKIKTFRVGQPSKGMKFREVMGREDVEDESPDDVGPMGGEVEEVPDTEQQPQPEEPSEPIIHEPQPELPIQLPDLGREPTPTGPERALPKKAAVPKGRAGEHDFGKMFK